MGRPIGVRGARRPDLRGPIDSAGQEHRAVRAPGDRQHGVRQPQGRPDRLHRGGVADLGRPVAVAHQDHFAVGRLSHVSQVREALRGNGHALRSRTRERPEPRKVIAAAGQDRPAVGPEGHGQDLARVVERITQRLAAGDIPEPCGLVLAPGQGDRPFGVQGHGRDPARMPQRPTQRFSSPRVPEPRRLIVAPRDGDRSIAAEGHGSNVSVVMQPCNLPAVDQHRRAAALFWTPRPPIAVGQDSVAVADQSSSRTGRVSSPHGMKCHRLTDPSCESEVPERAKPLRCRSGRPDLRAGRRPRRPSPSVAGVRRAVGDLQHPRPGPSCHCCRSRAFGHRG